MIYLEEVKTNQFTYVAEENKYKKITENIVVSEKIRREIFYIHLT